MSLSYFKKTSGLNSDLWVSDGTAAGTASSELPHASGTATTVDRRTASEVRRSIRVSICGVSLGDERCLQVGARARGGAR